MPDDQDATNNPPAATTDPPTGLQSVEDYQLELTRVRRENGNWRTRLRETERERDSHAERASRFDNVVTELGFQDEKDFDPKKFASDFRSLQDEFRQERLSNVVLKSAAELGANPDLLLDSSSFQSKAKALDLSSADFAGQVSALVKEAVEANPAYKAGPKTAAVPKLGPETPGGSSEHRITQAELSRMSAAGETAKIAKLLSEGKLKHLT